MPLSRVALALQRHGMTIDESSVYDINAPRLRARGYRVHPIGPGTKKPQVWVPSLGQYQDAPAWNDPRRAPITSPQPGAGICLLTGEQSDGTHIFALDFDDDEVALAAMEQLPATIDKCGKRGYTPIYRSKTKVESRDFRLDGKCYVQVLSGGKQTVIPPTVHPDTGGPYTFSRNDWTLYTCCPADIPEAPANWVEIIEGILRPLGYEPELEKPARQW
jgi:hypothetical protein